MDYDEVAPGAVQAVRALEQYLRASELEPLLIELYKPKVSTSCASPRRRSRRLRTWSAIRDEALKKRPLLRYPRSDLKPARSSSERNFGCSQAAKCPPLGSLL